VPKIAIQIESRFGFAHLCFVTINLFSLYLINFMFQTMLDAAGECVLAVHYKSMKYDVFHFTKVA